MQFFMQRTLYDKMHKLPKVIDTFLCNGHSACPEIFHTHSIFGLTFLLRNLRIFSHLFISLFIRCLDCGPKIISWKINKTENDHWYVLNAVLLLIILKVFLGDLLIFVFLGARKTKHKKDAVRLIKKESNYQGEVEFMWK